MKRIYFIAIFISLYLLTQAQVFKTIGSQTIIGNLNVGGTITGNNLISNNEITASRNNLDIGGVLILENTAKLENGQAKQWKILNMGGGYGNSLQFWAYDNLGCNSGGMCTSRFTIMDNGNVGIGTTSPKAKLDITSNSTDGFIKLNTTSGNPRIVSNAGLFLTSSSTNTDFYGAGSTVAIGQVNESEGIGVLNIVNGRVGVGLHNPDELLTINGIVHAKEVRVDLTGSLADYVFSPDYSLMPLHKVEAFVKTNKHLPEIPSAAEVKEKGLSMGEMQNKLLQKIEELTLYVIEQQKRIEQLEKSQK